MERFFIWLSFDGSAYHGWQKQPKEKSVQQVLQDALSTILRQQIDIVGAGRTDAGVHAHCMVAHFDIDKQIDCTQLAYKLNKLLPKDIAIERIEQVENDLHARFSATSRTYHYYLHQCKDPFLRHYSFECYYPLDFELMDKAASSLMRYSDFAAFSKTHTDVKTTLCELSEARWIQTGEKTWVFRITANRFLRNMVRAIVGTLIEIGRGRLSLEDFHEVIRSGDRCKAGDSMPANALFLEEVRY